MASLWLDFTAPCVVISNTQRHKPSLCVEETKAGSILTAKSINRAVRPRLGEAMNLTKKCFWRPHLETRVEQAYYYSHSTGGRVMIYSNTTAKGPTATRSSQIAAKRRSRGISWPAIYLDFVWYDLTNSKEEVVSTRILVRTGLAKDLKIN